jgi:hypothetical protein
MVGAPPPVLVSRRSRRRRLTHRVPRGAARFLFAAINWFGMPDHGEATKVRRSAAQKQGAPDPIRSAPTASLPQFIPPQLAMLVDKPPAGDRWVHEIKHDGYRTAARIEAGQVQMLTRKGLDWTAHFEPNRNGYLFFSGTVGTGFRLRVGTQPEGPAAQAQSQRRRSFGEFFAGVMEGAADRLADVMNGGLRRVGGVVDSVGCCISGIVDSAAHIGGAARG